MVLNELDNEGLARLVDGKDRVAIAEVLFAYHDGTHCQVFSGSVRGSVAEQPRGDRGFGWDPIFIPEGSEKTWGEMTLEEQKGSSMRRIALQKLQDFLKK